MADNGCSNCAPCCVCGEDSHERDEENARLRVSEDDIWLLKALSRDINRTAYHGGLGLQESGKYLAVIDRILAANGESV